MRKLPRFEDLMKLTDQELEELKRDFIEDLINSSETEDQKRRLRGLQFKIDMEKKKSKSPLDFSRILTSLLQDKFEELKSLLVNTKELEKPFKQDISSVIKVDFERGEEE